MTPEQIVSICNLNFLSIYPSNFVRTTMYAQIFQKAFSVNDYNWLIIFNMKAIWNILFVMVCILKANLGPNRFRLHVDKPFDMR